MCFLHWSTYTVSTGKTSPLILHLKYITKDFLMIMGGPLNHPGKKIAATIIDTDNSCGVFQYHVADCVGYMKKHLKSASPLEAGFWCYTAKKPERIFTLD